MRDKRDAETPNGTRPLQPDTASTGCFCFRCLCIIFFFYPKHPFYVYVRVCARARARVFKGLDPSPPPPPCIYLRVRPSVRPLDACTPFIRIFILFIWTRLRPARDYVTSSRGAVSTARYACNNIVYYVRRDGVCVCVCVRWNSLMKSVDDEIRARRIYLTEDRGEGIRSWMGGAALGIKNILDGLLYSSVVVYRSRLELFI